MRPEEIPELGEEGSKRWKAEIATWLEGSKHSTWREVAHEFDDVRTAPEGEAEKRENSATTDISRFIKGERSTLRSWFGPRRNERLLPFARALGKEPGDFERLLFLVHRGDGPGDKDAWHPAFPSVSKGQVEIPPRLVEHGGEPKAPERAIEELRRFFYEPMSMGRKDLPPLAWFTGPPGTGRTTAARIYAKEVRDAQYKHLCEEARKEHERHRRDGAPPMPPPPLEVVVLLEQPSEGWQAMRAGKPGPFLAMVDTLPRECHPWQGQRVFTVASWRPEEIEALSRRLREVGAMDQGALDAGLDVSRRSRSQPYLLGPGVGPGQVITVLGKVASSGVPDSADRLRSWLLEDAWQQAVRRAPPRTLDALGPSLMSRLWSRRWLADPGQRCWSMSESDALALLREVLAELPREQPLDHSWQAHLDQLVKERSPGKREVLAGELRRDLLAGEPAVVLAALVSGGLLRRTEDGIVAASPDQARTWTAKGLVERGGLGLRGRWHVLTDPEWARLMPELAVAGLRPELLERELDGVPPWAAVDLALLRVYHAAALPEAERYLVDPEILRDAWHSALWAGLFGAPDRCRRWISQQGYGWFEEPLLTALRAVSVGYMDILPELESDDVWMELEARVSEAVRSIVEPFRRLLPPHDQYHPRLEEIDEQYRVLARAAPAQCLPWNSARWRQWRGTPGMPSPWPLMERLASRGHARAVAFLSGATDAPPEGLTEAAIENELRWDWLPALPAPMRLRWAGKGEDVGQEAFRRLWGLVGAVALPENQGKQGVPPLTVDGHPPDWMMDLVMEALHRFPREMAEEALDRDLSQDRLLPYGKRSWSSRMPAVLDIELCKRLDLAGPLERFLEAHQRWRNNLRLGVLAGQVVLIDLARDASTLLVPPRQVEKDQTLPAFAVLETQEALALEAAAALHGMDRPEALRSLWNDGKGPPIPEGLLADAGWSDLVARATRAGLEAVASSKIPVQACRKALGERLKMWKGLVPGRRHRQAPSLHVPVIQHLAGAGVVSELAQVTVANWAWAADSLSLLEQPADQDNPCTEHAALERKWLWARRQGMPLFFCKQGSFEAHLLDPLSRCPSRAQEQIPKVDIKTRTALLALEALTNECLTPPPRGLLAWLERLKLPHQHPFHGNFGEHPSLPWPLDQHRRTTAEQAGALLLELGDLLPVESWLAFEALEGKERRCAPEAIWTVRKHLEQDSALVERTWVNLKDPTHCRILLEWAAYTTGGTWTPMGWVFTALLQSDNAEPPRRAFLDHVWQDRRAIPLMGVMAREAQDPRERSYWSYRLHHHKPYCEAFVVALRRFMLHDEDPFRGGPLFNWDGLLEGWAQARITGGALNLLRQALAWPGTRERRHVRWMLEGARRLFWRLVKDYPELHHDGSYHRVAPNPGEPEELDDILDALARLLELLDDKETLKAVFSTDLRQGAVAEIAESRTEELDLHFRSPFIPWWTRTRPPLVALAGLRWAARGEVLSRLKPAELLTVFRAGTEDSRAAAQLLLMSTGMENSPHAREIGEWTAAQLRQKEKLDWQPLPQYILKDTDPLAMMSSQYPDEDIDLLMMSSPERLLEQVEAIATEQPDQRTWLLDALLLFARQEGCQAHRARALARRLAQELGSEEAAQ